MKCLKSKAAVLLYAVLIFCFVSFQIQGDRLTLFGIRGAAETNSREIVLYMLAFAATLFGCRWLVNHMRGHRGALFYLLAAGGSMIFAFMSIIGKYYCSESSSSFGAILRQGGGFLKAGLCFLGGCFLFFFVLMGLGMLRDQADGKKTSDSGAYGRCSEFLFGKYCYLKVCSVIGLCWLPQVLIRYPGFVSPDAANSLRYYVGIKQYSTVHPIIYTQLFGRLVDLGTMLGNPNYGLYALVWLQIIALAAAFAYLILTMSKLSMPRWCCLLALVVCALSPNAVAYGTSALIDPLYIAAFTVFVTELVYYLFRPEEYERSWRHLLLMAVSVAGTFFRYNGIYIVAIVFVFVLFRELWLLMKRKQRLRYTLAILLVLAVPVFIGKAEVRRLNQKYDAGITFVRAKYALPMQQVACYMIDHGEELSEDEFEKLKKVVRYDVSEYKKKYKPYTFDGIKHGFNQEATSEEIRDFLAIWLKMLIRHPITCAKATIRQNFILFCPLVTDGKYYEVTRRLADTGELGEGNFFVENTGSEWWIKTRQNLVQYYYAFMQSPIGGIMLNLGWNDLILFGICLYALCEKRWKLLLLAIPILLVLAIIFVGPTILGHPRYAFPLLYTLPLLLGAFMRGDKIEPGNAAEE